MNLDRHPARVLARPDDPIPTHPTGRDLTAARLRAALSPAELGAWTGRHRTTIARMERGEARVDRAVWYLLLVLGGLHPWPAWAGWRTVGDAIYSPHDLYRGYKPEHLEWAAHWRALALALEEERDLGDTRPAPVLVGDADRRDPGLVVAVRERRARKRGNRSRAVVDERRRNARGRAVARRPRAAVARAVIF